MTRSSKLCASRMEPSPALATNRKPSSRFTPSSASQMRCKRSTTMDGDSLKIEPLNPRQNGIGNAVRFGGRKDKDHVIRRLLQCLQQCIEGPLRKHMNLIYDVDFLSASLWQISNGISKISNIVYRVVGRSIDLNDIWRSPCQDVRTVAHLPQGVGVGPCSQFSARANTRAAVVFPTPLAPVKRKPWCTRSQLDRVLQGLCHMTLSRNFFKSSWPPFSGDGLVGHGGLHRSKVMAGYPDAPQVPLPLLPSGPGGIHEPTVTEARPSPSTLKRQFQ